MGAPTVYALEKGHWELVRGVRRWVPDPDPVAAIPHGTDAGYYRHKRYKVAACDKCIEAHAAETAKREGWKHTPGRRRVRFASCGTESGHKKHRREKTTICDACKKAHAEANARRRAQARAEKQERRAA